MRRVAVTGMGVVTPIGIGREAFWQALMAGKRGVGRISHFDPEGFPTTIGAEIRDFPAEEFLDRKEARRTDLFIQYAVAAAKLAVEDAGLALEDEEEKDRMGVLVGSGIGGIQTVAKQFEVLREKGPRRVSPFLVPMLIANMASGYISIILGLRGPNTTVVTACATGTHAIGDAGRIIQRGDADVMLAGGTEAPFTAIAVAGFCAARAMTTRNDEPERASRPFDRERDGFVMGEGSGILVLEEWEYARKRGARIYGELAGYGLTGDAYHLTAPDPEGSGAVRCMRMALKDAGVSPEEVGYINAHGTSTPYNDKIETLAIKKVFGERAYRIPVNSTKSMTGHLLGAAGGVELAATLLSLERGWVHPTVNYEYPDPECDLDYVPNTPREHSFTYALSNSFGFGGTNACLLVKRAD